MTGQFVLNEVPCRGTALLPIPMNQLFGTDGIRGVVNKYPITPEVALRISQAAAHLTKSMACITDMIYKN